MKLWSRPTKFRHWVLFVVGFSLFWILSPLWFTAAVLLRSPDTAFVIAHLQAAFYNPWKLR